MPSLSRRKLLQAAAIGSFFSSLPLAIRQALAIPANNRTGTIKDVEHVVILMQENRSFDHYFGTFPGVRGFSDRFTIPLPGQRTVWEQQGKGRLVMPYHLDSSKGNAQRVSGTPHSWVDAHSAWDNGRMSAWPTHKTATSMGYYREQELPFQFALANTFTLCDAYHCSVHAGTNPNRLFLWTGSNGPSAAKVAAVVNEWDGPGAVNVGYSWKTYPERLEEQGVSWKVYQHLPDNFGDNPLAGFRQYRAASVQVGNPAQPPKDFNAFVPYSDALNAVAALYKGNGNTLPASSGSNLEAIIGGFRNDVQAGKLPQVSWIVAPAAYSEHPGPSSPVQGGWFTQEILLALTRNPEVWSKTVLLLTYDENDGFFDHMPSPSAPSQRQDGSFAGKSTLGFDSELFKHPAPPGSTQQPLPDGGVYGPGPRVPMLVLSPWSRGGWVNSQVFDHTSVLQFLEKRFGVREPNISAWRRAVCGDLTSALNFVDPNHEPLPALQTTTRQAADALRQRQEKLLQVPLPLASQQLPPHQPRLARPSRALPYRLHVDSQVDPKAKTLSLSLQNTGEQGAVFHVYDGLHLSDIPRRYTVEAGKALQDSWPVVERYQLWVLGPNGFHRSFSGQLQQLQPELLVTSSNNQLQFTLSNPGTRGVSVTIDRCPYTQQGPWTLVVPGGAEVRQVFACESSGGWYDLTLRSDAGWLRRVAGRLETGAHSISDPLMGRP
ncbi:MULTISPECIES: phosphocholine-specific phospholipase C [Pseudomonas]|uniref:phosphocholine-specific phospholipase C n=1 Tax=Pseudomonas TaxID=286 RepID=UPI000C9CF32E|nr:MULTISPECIES: phospholipase C, phosphocholine-specific [Pseudomonas]MCY7259732.1 phospholipase C, phosphocholine-specific [Pseudomonas protegens]MDC7815322.1 phospholipase C, phosphocholine-specific [Pseudomonas sp. BLCC-B112]MDP9509758.1 phospholipase C, phosphocholine-specific [Pseudomonas protegens]PNG37919.1 phospholipase C, phosphocholine-specific [Pseudomonas protegens]PYB96798.1 phospholipase C, phosphocholine-specific [Pseudomonas protegens]